MNGEIEIACRWSGRSQEEIVDSIKDLIKNRTERARETTDYRQIVYEIYRAYKRGANRVHMGGIAMVALGISE